MTRSAEELGQILSRLHWQCWRANPPSVEIAPAELMAVLPILIRSGSVGLVWPRLRELDPAGAIALALEDAYRAQVAHNETCQREIARSVTRLREAGIEPLLVKGWSVSRMYPAPLVRPAGDIDLVVRPEDFTRAKELLTGPDAPPITVGLDLKHPAVWEEKPNDDFWDRLCETDVNGVLVRVLGTEDQLRMMCFHLLKHEGMRPLWLTDIALAIESRPREFNWNIVLGQGKVERNWVAVAIGLTRQLVGTSVCDTPVFQQSSSLPGWLVPLVYRRWREPRVRSRGATLRFIENPSSLPRILADHWPGPIVSSMFCHATINAVPRLPWQLLLFGKRLSTHLVHGMHGQISAAMQSKRLTA